MSDCVRPQRWQPIQIPPSLGFPRQEYWSGLPFPSPMHESEKWKWSRSVMSDPQRPHGVQPTRLLHSCEFPGKNTGVGCHCLLQSIQIYQYSYKHCIRREEIFSSFPSVAFLIVIQFGNFLARSSVQFSSSVVSYSLQPHGMQHSRPPYPSPTPGIYSNSCPLSQWCHPTISSSSCLQSFPALRSFGTW